MIGLNTWAVIPNRRHDAFTSWSNRFGLLRRYLCVASFNHLLQMLRWIEEGNPTPQSMQKRKTGTGLIRCIRVSITRNLSTFFLPNDCPFLRIILIEYSSGNFPVYGTLHIDIHAQPCITYKKNVRSTITLNQFPDRITYVQGLRFSQHSQSQYYQLS